MAGLRLCLALLCAAGGLSAEISLSGHLRDDAVLIGRGRDSAFLNLLEGKLVLERFSEDWRFYSDARVKLLNADPKVAALAGAGSVTESLTGRLLRAFIRYQSPIGEFDLGKTYVTFGLPGVFNPFELDQSLDPADISYTKEGLTALAHSLELGSLSGLKSYICPVAKDGQLKAGAALFTNLAGFDFGLVGNRFGANDNLYGAYFKGDLGLGIQAAVAGHADDLGRGAYTEAMAGLDYSFFAGTLILGAQGRYRDSGPPASAASPLKGRGYGYFSVLAAPHEFFRASVDAFVNTVDTSALVIPSATWILADGLSLTLQMALPTAEAGEFSRSALGDYSGRARVEAKL